MLSPTLNWREFQMLPLHLITFEIDANVDITSLVLCDMVVVDHSVKQLAALQMSISSPSIQEQISAQPDWDWYRLWQQEQHYYTIINRF